MFDAKLIAAQLDGRVLAALLSVPTDAPIEDLLAAGGVTMDDMRASLRRLALRQPGINWPWASASDLDNSSPAWWPAARVARMV